MALIKRSGDYTKCTAIFIVGIVLIICGLPLMITGIAATFTAADLVGYIGGICIFFGIGFFLLWYMFTIESKDSMLPIPEYDPSLKTISDIVNKSRAKERSRQSVGGFSNAAFVSDVSEDELAGDVTVSAVTIDGNDGDESATTAVKGTGDVIDGSDLSAGHGRMPREAKGTLSIFPVSLETPSRNDSSVASSRQSIPVEVT